MNGFTIDGGSAGATPARIRAHGARTEKYTRERAQHRRRGGGGGDIGPIATSVECSHGSHWSALAAARSLFFFFSSFFPVSFSSSPPPRPSPSHDVYNIIRYPTLNRITHARVRSRAEFQRGSRFSAARGFHRCCHLI